MISRQLKNSPSPDYGNVPSPMFYGDPAEANALEPCRPGKVSILRYIDIQQVWKAKRRKTLYI